MRNLGTFIALATTLMTLAGIANFLTETAHASTGSSIEVRSGDFAVVGKADALSTDLRITPLTPIIGQLRFNDEAKRFEVSEDGKPFETLATHGELDHQRAAVQGLIWANESLTERQGALGVHFDVLLAFLVVGYTVMGIVGWALFVKCGKLRDEYVNLRRDVESLNRAVTPPRSQNQGPMRTPGDNRPPPTRVPSGGRLISMLASVPDVK